MLFSHSVVSNSFAIPWTVAHQAPLCMGFPRQECWNRLLSPSPGDLPDLGIEPVFSELQADSLLLSYRGSPKQVLSKCWISEFYLRLRMGCWLLVSVFIPGPSNSTMFCVPIEECNSVVIRSDQISRSVMSDSATPWIAAHQASLSRTMQIKHSSWGWSICESQYHMGGFPGGSVVKNLPANAGDTGSVPGSGRSPGEGNSNPLQCSCLGNLMHKEPGGLPPMGSYRVGHALVTTQ